MKAFIIFLFIAVTVLSCKDKEECCDDPELNKEWMQSHIEEINNSSLKQYFYISKAEYNGQCIVYVSNCCPMCASTIIPYRCDDGTRVENVDLTFIQNHKIAWQPENSACQFQ